MPLILATNFSGISLSSLFQHYVNRIPLSLVERSLRYKFLKDRCAYILGKALLARGLVNFGLPAKTLYNLRYTEFERPFLNVDLDFNISHSGAYVVCALSRKFRVGIDIEEIKQVEVPSFRNSFTKEEFLHILCSPNNLLEFFKYWTMKEAVMKADGRGMNIPLKEIKIINNKEVLVSGVKWNVMDIGFDTEFPLMLATNQYCGNNYQLQQFNCLEILN